MKIVKQNLTDWLVVGDVHNTCDYLVKILERAKDYKGIVFVGDLLDRGPDPIGTIDLVTKLRAETNVINIMGNHDWKLLRAYNGRNVTLFDAHTHALIRDKGKVKDFEAIFDEEIVGVFDTDNKIFVSHAAGGKPLKILRRIYEAKRNENKFLFDDFDHFLSNDSHTISKKVTGKLLYGLTTGEVIDDLPVRLPVLKEGQGVEALSSWQYIFGHIHATDFHPEGVEDLICVDLSCGKPNGRLGAVLLREGPYEFFIEG